MDESTLEKPKPRAERPASHDPAAESWTRELMYALAAWARHTFSLPSLLNGLKSLLWVAPLSVLIWIYADRELTPPPQTVSIQIAPHSKDPNRVVRLIEPSDGRIRADIDGPNAQLQTVIRQIEAGTPVDVDIPESLLQKRGNSRIEPERLTSLLNDLPLFSQRSITVQSVATEMVVDVDVLEERELEVQAAPDGKTFAELAFEPRKVRVRAPRSVFDSGDIVVYAHLDQAKESLIPGPQEQDLTQIPLTLSKPADNVTITPATVSAHVKLKKSDVTMALEPIPVWATYPFGVDDKYKAVYDPTIAGVQVTGPEDQVRALIDHSSTFIPRATFEVNAADPKVGVPYQAILSFKLPPGVHETADFAQKAVTYHLVERKSSSD